MGFDHGNAKAPSTTAVPKGEIPSLDGLRAVSIVLVLIGHALGFSPHSFLFRALFSHADMGVRVFFIISGFLITSLLFKERSDFGSISLKLFYIRRALRILPAFFLFVGCVALLCAFGIVTLPHLVWLYVLTYTVNYLPFKAWPVAHLWSLSVEEQFYLLWPLLVKNAKTRTCAIVACLAIAAGPATHLVHRLTGLPWSPYGFALRCGPIAMGCLLAVFHRRIRAWITSSKLLSDGRSLILLLPLVALLDAIPNTLGILSLSLDIVTNALLTLCVARLIFIPTGLSGRLLNSLPLVLLGKLSYSIYLWQQLFLPLGSPEAVIPAPFPLPFIAIIALASLSYWGLEVRFLRLRKAFRRKNQLVASPDAVVPPAKV